MSRFVVSTGRCGSTLLSSLLATHPGVLSISESLGALHPGARPPGQVDPRDFWALLSEPQPAWSVPLRHGIEPPEALYPVDAGRRFDRETGVPPIAAVTLPALSDDPDGLFDELEQAVLAFPPAEVGVLYGRMFDWLAQRFDRPVWVERTGSSLLYVEQVVRHFPAPRIVHLYRDGRETALSMSRHTTYRMFMVRQMLHDALGYDPYVRGSGRPGAFVPPVFRPLMPDTFDPRVFAAQPIPVERFGRHWSALILRGMRRLAGLPPGNVWHLAYEELVADPRAQLATLVAFLELPEPPAGWLDRAAAQVIATPLEWPDLPPDERDRLKHACEPGQAKLRRLVS